jgi:polygalacturonase
MKTNLLQRTFFLSLLTLLSIRGEADNHVVAEQTSQNTPEGWQTVNLPIIPDITPHNTIYITDYGATISSADNTIAIQKALNAVPASGGMVVIPAGEWLCGPVKLKSKTILHLAAHATLKLLPYGIYPAITSGGMKFDNFIDVQKNATDIIIEGEDKYTSLFDGQGKEWWIAYENNKSISRGAVIRMSKGTRFLIRNVMVKNAPGVNISIGQNGKGSHGTVHDVIIREPASTTKTEQPSHNTDGISVWGPYVNIYNCDIDNGDDNVVVDSDGRFVHVWNCTFGNGHGASMGSYTSNMHDILWENINFFNTESGFRLKSQRGRSGDVYNITFRNCMMKNVNNPIYIECWYDKSIKPEPPYAPSALQTSTTPNFHDILIQNVTSVGTPYKKSSKSNFPVYIYGLPEEHVRNITFDNVLVQAEKGMFVAYCDNINFINGCKIINSKSTSKIIEEQYQAEIIGNCNSYVTGINTVSMTTSTDSSAKVYDVQGHYLGVMTQNQLLKKKPGIYLWNSKKILVR